MRRNFNDGQEIVFQDLNKISAAIERGFYDRVIFELVQKSENAFFGDSFKVQYVSPTSVSVAAGLGFQTDGAAVSPEPTKKPLFRASSSTLNLQAPDATNDRIDLVVTKYLLIDDITESRKYKAPVTSVISNENIVVQKDLEAELLVVTGTPAPSPVAPAIPSGYILLATLNVPSVVGMAGSGDVTDERDLMPVAGSILINTLGKQRVTAGAAVSIDQLIADIDALLYRGYQNYTDFDVLGADPSAPGASKVRFYQKGGVFYFRESGGAINPVGSGGGGGGGATWHPVGGNSPTESEENSQNVYLFEQGLGQQLTLFVRVPSSYIAGRQIKVLGSAYSPSASNTFLMSATTTLIRKNVDAITSTLNQYPSTNTALTNAVANRYRELDIDLTNATGAINSIAVQPGDLLKIELTRGTDTDTADVRFIPSATEVKFG